MEKIEIIVNPLEYMASMCKLFVGAYTDKMLLRTNSMVKTKVKLLAVSCNLSCLRDYSRNLKKILGRTDVSAL